MVDHALFSIHTVHGYPLFEYSLPFAGHVGPFFIILGQVLVIWSNIVCIWNNL